MPQDTFTCRFVKGAEICRMENQVTYKAIDRSQGCSVAWIEWELLCFKQEKRAKKAKKLITHLELWSKIKSDYLLVLLCDEQYPFALNEEKTAVIGIAELMCTTLKSFLDKAGGVSAATIQNWGVQICRGLNFLHTASPRVIHRNLKLESIFYDAKEARLKIGDLSTAKIIYPEKPLPKCKKGPRDRRAPEYYAFPPGYDCKVDIWSFGLCLLEMATLLAPYHEFGSTPESLEKIEKAVIKGVKPRSLQMIDSPESLTLLISSCLEMDPKKRPKAAVLLESEFLKNKIPQRDLFVQFKPEFRQEIAKNLTTNTNRASGGYPVSNQLLGQLPEPGTPASPDQPPCGPVLLSGSGSVHLSPPLSPHATSPTSSGSTLQGSQPPKATSQSLIRTSNAIKQSQNPLRRSGLSRLTPQAEDVILSESEIIPQQIPAIQPSQANPDATPARSSTSQSKTSRNGPHGKNHTHTRKHSDEDVLIKLPSAKKRSHERRPSQDEVVLFHEPHLRTESETHKQTPKRSPPSTGKNLSATESNGIKKLEESGKTTALQETQHCENFFSEKNKAAKPTPQSTHQPEATLEDEETKDKGWLKKFDTHLKNFVASSHHT